MVLYTISGSLNTAAGCCPPPQIAEILPGEPSPVSAPSRAVAVTVRLGRPVRRRVRQNGPDPGRGLYPDPGPEAGKTAALGKTADGKADEKAGGKPERV